MNAGFALRLGPLCANQPGDRRLRTGKAILQFDANRAGDE
jgi:hypothetical protein